MSNSVGKAPNAHIPPFAAIVGIYGSQTFPPIWCVDGRYESEPAGTPSHALCHHESLDVVRDLLRQRGYAISDGEGNLDEATGEGLEIWHRVEPAAAQPLQNHPRCESDA